MLVTAMFVVFFLWASLQGFGTLIQKTITLATSLCRSFAFSVRWIIIKICKHLSRKDRFYKHALFAIL